MARMRRRAGRRLGKDERRNAEGFWQDRYLILPKRLQKSGRKIWFLSKKGVRGYLLKESPGADLDCFFSSFEWDGPSAAEVGNTTASGNCGRKSGGGNVVSEGKSCKAGNLNCGLETGKNRSLKAMNCDICCVEHGFCRECSCILCGKATDQSVGNFSSIRCEGKLTEEFVCGHIAHLECALLCHMAGVEQTIGLDVEYYCRRCDKKTDLTMHIEGLFHASGCTKVRIDVEKNLSLALRIMQGTHQTVGRRLENIICSALMKLRSGVNLQDIVELHGNLMGVDAGKATDESVRFNYQPKPLNIPPVSLVNSGGPTPEATSQKGSSLVNERQRKRSRALQEDANGASDLLSSPVHITALKFENKINQALHGLRRSQEAEYKLAQEKLYAQKDFLLSLFQDLDTANSEFANSSSSSSLESFDDLFVGISDRVGRLKKENSKFGQMLKITHGFGRTQKDVLRDFFGVSLEDGEN